MDQLQAGFELVYLFLRCETLPWDPSTPIDSEVWGSVTAVPSHALQRWLQGRWSHQLVVRRQEKRNQFQACWLEQAAQENEISEKAASVIHLASQIMR